LWDIHEYPARLDVNLLFTLSFDYTASSHLDGGARSERQRC
jgi:hypothetical protein